ncbi:putative 4-hydroxy-2-oxoglutarate aldolase [Colletotrichum sidae]|uniref:Putative 4-hydroxy-2-oxoglutarate aldolase n=1 Tax=Colletotrichum sidae TaxID=1347389 RepID=A0A4R8TNG4_9PEZI|nr:putative 4-hydroxy-2-oxoglutarate aldolase [Colletotrichum sidae]
MASRLPANGRLVDIGSHSLALYSHGPDPSSFADPVVVFVSGIASDALNWQAVTRLLGSSVRSYSYDRSGYRNSESSPIAPTAENVALELSLLLDKASIKNPLIFVGHSWAGVLINEYFALKGTEQVAGLVLVDANHETAPLVVNVNDPTLWTVAAGVDVWVAWGTEAEHKLTQEEWETFRSAEATDKYKLIADTEEENYASSFETLRRKGLAQRQPLLGNKPVYVIAGTRSRDWRRLYDAGVAKGNGTEEQRSHVGEMIRTVDEKTTGLMKEFLKLSTKGELKPPSGRPRIRTSEDVDTNTLERHLVRLMNAGVAGFVVHGSNGEAFHLSREERSAMIRCAADIVHQEGHETRMPLIAGCGAQSTRKPILLCRDAFKSGASHALLLPPSYYGGLITDEKVVQFFHAVAGSSPIPLVMYNFPTAAAGRDLSPDTWWIKPPRGSSQPVAARISILQGQVVGANGTISELANIAPRACVRIMELAADGKVAEAKRLQAVVARGDWIAIQTGFVGVKAAIGHFVQYGGPPRKPCARPSSEELKQIADGRRELRRVEMELEKEAAGIAMR